MINQFEFPSNQIDYLLIDDYKDLRNRLQIESKSLNMQTHYFRISAQKHKYIYARCQRYCTSRLAFKRHDDDNKYSLSKFVNTHNHEVVT